jgi:hypothetical protein
LAVGPRLKNGALVNVVQVLLVAHYQVLRQVLPSVRSDLLLVELLVDLADSLVEEFSQFKIITIREIVNYGCCCCCDTIT